jgi:tetratricopeptide (TPR) repeat protein
MSKFTEALTEYGKTIAIDPTDDAYFNKGNMLLNLGRYEEALAAYDKAITIN